MPLQFFDGVYRQRPTPLMSVCAAGDVEMIELLIQHGADINLTHHYLVENHYDKHIYADSPLLSACCRCHLVALQALLDRGADPNRPDKNSETTMTNLFLRLDPATLMSEGVKECVELLLMHADVNHVNRDGNTPLHCLILLNTSYMHPSSPAVRSLAELLLECGADVTITNKRQQSVLDLVWYDSELEAFFKEYLDRKPLLK